MKTIIKTPDGREVWCYGEIEENSNFNMVCEDEFNDGIIADIDGIDNWKELVYTLYSKGFKDIEQIEAC